MIRRMVAALGAMRTVKADTIGRRFQMAGGGNLPK